MKVAYTRVSTEEQNLDRQTDMMATLGVEKVFSDKASGRDTSRPGLKELLSFVRQGDEVVVESISRLARSTGDLLDVIDHLDKKGVSFRSVKEALDTTSPQGRFVLTIFGALATLERDTILQRQKEGIASARARGKHLGRPKATLPSDSAKVLGAWRKTEITAVEAMKALKLSKTTFYKLVATSEGD